MQQRAFGNIERLCEKLYPRLYIRQAAENHEKGIILNVLSMLLS